ncbi:MAG: hypothetical protein ACOCZE_13265, partial [Planctomycetota bacterium]
NALSNLSRDPVEILNTHPSQTVFVDLGENLDSTEPNAELTRLVEAYAKREPQSAAVAYYKARLAYLDKDYAAAAELLTPDRSESLRDYEYAWASVRVRALQRAGRTGDALRVAGDYYEQAGDPWLLAVVHALDGNTAKLTAAMQQIENETEFSPADLYNDSEVGPLLRENPSFQAIREKWPAPAEEPAEGAAETDLESAESL